LGNNNGVVGGEDRRELRQVIQRLQFHVSKGVCFAFKIWKIEMAINSK
jgi:hypothetical protein